MIDVVAAIIRRNDGTILITQRPSHVHLPGLWEFPGGKVESNESLEAALRREIHEELGIDIQVHDEFFSTEHHYAEKSVHLHFFNCTMTSGEPQPIGVCALQWVKCDELDAFAFPEADAELIARLRKS